MKIDYNHLGYWLGDEHSLEVQLHAEREIKGKMFEGDEGEPFMRLLSISDGVATVSVKGSLTSKDSYWNQYFGVTSYNEIRNAIVTAVDDSEVEKILLDIDSGGGDAKGVSELADFIKTATTHKPVTAYVSGSAFSAAYWIASAADSIVGPEMAEAGSIGVIAMIPDYSKAYAKKGIKIHVIRSGKYKALGNGYEKLSLAAQNILQAKLDKMYGFFLDAVSDNRGIPRDKVQSQVGEGLTFFAEEAVDNGLMDGVISFDKLYSQLVKVSNPQTGRMTLSEDDMKKRLLTKEAVAAKAAGASEEEIAALMADAPAEESQAPAPAAEEAEGEEAAAEEEQTAEEEEEAPTASDHSLVSYLKGEAATLRSENVTLQTKNIELASKLESAEANQSAMREAVVTFMEQMGVALGQQVSASADATNLVAQYTALRTKFTETFTVGAIANVEDSSPETTQAAAQTPAEKAMVRANTRAK